MRVIKSLNQGILTHSFVVAGKPREAVTAIYGFDLLDPNKRLSEQQLWQRCVELLGDVPLDLGMPKVQGEWLVCGSAYTGDKERQAVRVSAQVGMQHKALDVLGRRHWQKSRYGLSLSHPENFEQMPIRWGYAVRGEGATMNPVGISPPPNKNEAQGQLHAGIYYPGESQSEWSAKPRPAGFMPVDIMQPKRQKLLGTYNEEWQQTTWPNYAKDFDPLFYNVAPEDQRIAGYFQGGEPYALVNLHPDYETIQGKIPYFQPRAFLRRVVGENLVVSEVPLHCDTLWMFPDTNTGILLFHGSAPIDDEEGLDIQEVLLSEDPHGSVPKPIEYYVELFDRAQTTEYIAEQIGIDMSPMEEAKADIAKAEKLMEDAPKYMQFRIDQVKGATPSPQTSMVKANQVMMAQLDDRIASLAEMEKHLEKNPVNPDVKASVVKGQKELAGAKDKLAENIQNLSEMKNKVAGVSTKLSAFPDKLEKDKQDLESQLDELGDQFEIKHTWSDQASSLVYLANQNLTVKKFDEKKEQLESLGFRELYFQMYLLGWIDEQTPFIPEHWQLDGPVERETYGPGWVFAQHKEGEIKSITIRPDNISSAEADYLIAGSEAVGWHSGVEAPAKIIVTDLVSSWILAQALADYTDIIFLKEAGEQLDPEVEKALDESDHIYLACSSKTPLKDWQERFAKIKPLYYPQDVEIVHFHQQEIEPLTWLNEQLHSVLYAHLCDYKKQRCEERQKEVSPKQIYSQMKAHSDQKAVEAFGFNPMEHDDPVGFKMQQALNNLNSTMKSRPDAQRYDTYLDEVKKQFAEAKVKYNQPPELFADDSSELKKRFSDIKQQLDTASKKQNVPVEKMIDKEEFAQFEEKMMAMMVEMEPLKEKLKDLQGQMNQDEDRDYQELTRQDVIYRYAARLSFAKKNLSELDLSGIDLSGASFQDAILSKTNFSGCNLSGCQFSNAIADEADFTQSNVSKAQFHHAILTQTSFVKAEAKLADFSHATMVESNLAQANLTKTVWSSAMANQSCFVQADLRQSDLSNGVFIEADFTQADMKQSLTGQAVFNDATLRSADLRLSKGNKAIFWGVKGEGSQWDRAQLNGVRFGPVDLTKAHGRYADFSNCLVKGATFDKADFRGSNFSRGFMDSMQANHTLFDGANLCNAQLTRGNFQHSSFKAVNGMQSTLFRSQFQHADLYASNFYSADFRKIEFGNTHLKGINVDTTILHHKLEIFDEQE
ncbi:DUF2169 family type VI secretion system accessory protein [Vibrio marisflavi]|uniref:DUF2169 domain-containing protein n=1 Tax=Vibrio marisflavi CECT 7928 TaxID=634439 RepID=A0ABM8ZYW4_9VIBR|nr:DUF2169 domain-containing protein [Vibrio marisflavi]CAH0536124.1 hypothetical protein VMF7928_00218 [Vibrio marisflavi CECT 7928]